MAKGNNGFFAYYKEQPGWAKGLITLVLLAIVLLALYQGYALIKKGIEVAKAKKSLNTIDTNIKAMQQSGIKPSYSDSQYAAWANALQIAFDGYGTDEVAIENIILMMKKDIDVLKLIEAYGVREIKGGWLMPNFTGDLASTLASELDSNEIRDMNQNLRNNGIQFQF